MMAAPTLHDQSNWRQSVEPAARQLAAITAACALSGLLVGGGAYFLLRGLRIGPRWFEIVSMSGPAGVVIGSMLIHTDGIDFILPKPAYLPIAMFVALPAVFVVFLTVRVERWVAPGGWFMRAHRTKFRRLDLPSGSVNQVLSLHGEVFPGVTARHLLPEGAGPGVCKTNPGAPLGVAGKIL